MIRHDRILVAAVVLLASALLLAGCVGISDSTPGSQLDTTGSLTQETAAEPTPTEKLSPTPSPASVYIPRDELPDGRLFEAGLYAVLPGLGASYRVYDGFGELVGSFTNIDEYKQCYGLATLEELSRYWRPGMDQVDPVLPVEIKPYLRGFCQAEARDGKVQLVLYNVDGSPIFNRQFEILSGNDWEYQLTVYGYHGNTLILFRNYMPWGAEKLGSTHILTISPFGKILQEIVHDDNDRFLIGLCGTSHLLLTDEFFSDLEAYYLTDLAGNIEVETLTFNWNNSRLDFGAYYGDQEGQMPALFIDWYESDGQLYDNQLQIVSTDQTQDNGQLIWGNTYLVEEIACIADRYYEHWLDTTWGVDLGRLVAVGSDGDKMAIRSCDQSIVLETGEGAVFAGMNRRWVVYKTRTGQFMAVDLETKQVLDLSKADNVEVTDSYLLVSILGRDSTTLRPRGFYILDLEGQRRYAKYLEMPVDVWPTPYGERIWLERGPYVGIADLNGEWIIKTLAPDLTAD